MVEFAVLCVNVADANLGVEHTAARCRARGEQMPKALAIYLRVRGVLELATSPPF